MNKNIKKAKKQFRRGKYSDVIRMLEPEVFRNRENEEFYYYLGMACLFLGDYSGANSYLRRALQINPSNNNTMLSIAVIHLKHGNPSEAIRIYLDILDKEPNNKCAKKALDLLKKSGALEKIPEDFISKNLQKLLPGTGSPKARNFFHYLRIIFFSIIILGLLFFASKHIYSYVKKSKNIYPELTISRDINNITVSGDFTLELTNREVVSIFENAKKLFIENRDNEARVEINKLLNSNASEDVKSKAKILDSYLREPDFRYFKNSISYRQVIETPYLYNNCYVRWSGKIANIRMFQENAAFDFLVGYDSGKILEGIINVTTDFPANLDEQFTYEIIGQIDTNGQINMKAISLRNYL